MSKPSSPVKAELPSSPPSPQLPEPIKQEPAQALAITTNPPPQPSQNHRPPPPPQQPHFTDSIPKLRLLSDALFAFHRRYDELQEHLDFIRTSIDSKLLQLLDTETAPLTETLASDTEKADDNPPFPDDNTPIADDNTPVAGDHTPIADDITQSPKPKSTIEKLCLDMCSRSVRKYMVSNLDNVPKLREEVPLALKFARNPGKLVMECLGRFFLQGIRAYDKASPMIASRQASILVLEFFMLMGCDIGEIEKGVRKEAEEAAMEWRKRLISEGGLGRACEVDARGLLLLIGCFGIPKGFRNEDVMDLVLASNVREISGALRRSSVLVARISEVIEWMMKNKMGVEAVDIAYSFGMEGKFPAETILTSFLQECKETWKKARKASQGSSTALNKANRKNLAELKLVRKCIEDHKIDPLPEWKIDEKISKLKKDIADLDKKIDEQVKAKRKADEPESSKKLKNQEVKRTRYASPIPEHRKATAYIDHQGFFDGLTPMNSLGGGVPQYGNYSPYPSVVHGAGVGPSLGTGTHGDVPPMGSYSGVHGGVLVDRVGHVINNSGDPYGWGGEVSYRERLVGHNYAEPTALGTNGLYRAAPSMEGFAGLPNPSSIGVSGRSSNSGLYQFADAIVERETYAASRPGGAIPTPRVAPVHHSSYLY